MEILLEKLCAEGKVIKIWSYDEIRYVSPNEDARFLDRLKLWLAPNSSNLIINPFISVKTLTLDEGRLSL